MEKIERLVPDTSVIIDGMLSEKIEKKEIKVEELIIPEAVIAELEHQANENKSIGHYGLEEIKKLRTKVDKIRFAGERPKTFEIRGARMGGVDAIIRQVAFDEDATLMTSDKVQARVAEAKGIKLLYLKKEDEEKIIKLEKFFDDMTMSVHLRDNVIPAAKKGMPGNWEFVELTKKVITKEEIQEIAREIIEEAGKRRDGFIEIERPGSTIIQLGKYRIVICRPPFADGWEITAVRPVKQLNIEDYHMSEKLMKRVAEQADGILVAGSPGMGKCLPADETIYTKDMIPCNVRHLYNSDADIIYSVDKDGTFVQDKIISKHKRKESKLHIIETRTKRRIKVTPEHPLLVFEDDKICWKKAQDIRCGENIAILKTIRTKENDSLDLLKHYDPSRTLCFINQVDKVVPIFYKYLETKRKIVELIYLKKSCTFEEACKFSNKSRQVIQENIKKLNDIIYKKKGRYYLKEETYNMNDYGFLLLKDVIQMDIDKEKIEKIAYFTKNSSKLAFISLPKKVTPALCRFLAYIYSEGGGEKLSFTNTDETLVQDFKKCAKEVFGITEWKKCKLTHYVDWKASIKPLLDAWGYRISERKKSRTMELPNFLLRCSIDNLKNFLTVYFECDGGVEKGSRTIEYYTSSISAARQLTMLLMRFGIISSFHKKYRSGAYRYTIRVFDSDSIIKFSNILHPSDSKKYNNVILCKEKTYSQTFNYNLKPLINKFYMETKFKLKDRLSIEKCSYILQKFYEMYYSFSSKNENLLILLKEYIDRLHYAGAQFDEKKDKLNYSLLRKNKIDHNCLKHWKSGRRIKITTLNKVVSVLGCGVNVSPKEIAGIIKKTLSQQNVSISEIAKESSINCATLQFRLLNGWNTNIDELETVYNNLYDKFVYKRKEMEYAIKLLEILFKGDIVFDKIISNDITEGNFDVYDFETKNHNFICGELPLIVHNSTFAQALAVYYASKNKIVKTVEAPRDLILPDNITQYAISHGDSQEIHDILLLSRPDYTIFDEMRNTDDFKLFADLRLAGVGMVGVVHATNPIDAIQRFLGRIEMGVIPQITDTVVFIKNGQVGKVLSLNMAVKVPSGMTEADLARPVVEVHDFENNKLSYEIYSYGEQTVVVPVSETSKKQSGVQKLAADRIQREFMKYSGAAEVEVLSEGSVRVRVPKNDIAAIIGKQGRNIMELEDKLGLHIDIEELDKEPGKEIEGNETPFKYEITKKAVILYVGEENINKEVDIYINDEFLLSAKIGNSGNIKINKQSQPGKYLANSLNSKENVRLLI